MIMKSSYLRSSACCRACASSRVVSNCSALGSRTMGVMIFMGVLPFSVSARFPSADQGEDLRIRYVDPLMRSDAIAAHRLPHGKLEHLHVQRMEKIGNGDHRLGDGETAAAARQRLAHAVL